MVIERQRLFGNDLQLIPRGSDMDLRRQANGDYALAEGNDNIVQALTLRLRVREGELAPLGWPRFGSRLHELIGEVNNNRTRAVLMAHARTALERDPRISKIIGMTAAPLERNVVRLNIDLLLIDNPEPLNLVFDQSLEVA